MPGSRFGAFHLSTFFYPNRLDRDDRSRIDAIYEPMGFCCGGSTDVAEACPGCCSFRSRGLKLPLRLKVASGFWVS